MNKRSKSRAAGESNGEAEKQQLDTPSTSVERPSSTSDTSGNSPNPKSLIGFQTTKALGDLDRDTANARLVITFASELGGLVEWKRLTLADGREVIALCFSLGAWEITPNGELAMRR
jgi:hypothetical protein